MKVQFGIILSYEYKCDSKINLQTPKIITINTIDRWYKSCWDAGETTDRWSDRPSSPGAPADPSRPQQTPAGPSRPQQTPAWPRLWGFGMNMSQNASACWETIWPWSVSCFGPWQPTLRCSGADLHQDQGARGRSLHLSLVPVFISNKLTYTEYLPSLEWL